MYHDLTKVPLVTEVVLSWRKYSYPIRLSCTPYTIYPWCLALNQLPTQSVSSIQSALGGLDPTPHNRGVQHPISSRCMANCVLDESEGSKCPTAQEEVVLGRSKSYVSLAIIFTYHNV